MGIIKLTTLYFKRPLMIKLLDDINHFWKFEEIETEKIKKECKDILNKLNFVSYSLLVIALFPTFFFTIKPFLLGDLPFYAYTPDGIPIYVMGFYHNFAIIFGILLPVIAFDMFFFNMIILTQLQFRILNSKVSSLFVAVKQMLTMDQKAKLGKWVVHHNFLLRFIEKLNEAIVLPLLVYVVHITLSVCVELFVITNNEKRVVDAFKAISYAFAGLFQFTVFYCVPTQILINEAENLNYSISQTNWYEKPIRLKPTLIIILTRTHKLVSITAGKVIPLNVTTYLSTMKTIISYYMFLRTMSKRTDK